ncbi:competence protein TfoX [Verrucomicrobia bacterium LW23]|nr:competence protein TfoX [Verrucomicrobia bacterium LW23]
MPSSSRELAEHIADILRPLGRVVEVRRFFSGFELRVDGEQLLMLHESEIYFRVPTDALRAELREAGGAPFTYASSKRNVTVQRYFGAPADWIEDAERLLDFARRNLSALREEK